MDEDIRTIWCGNLSEKVTEEILYELFLQGGPIERVVIPKDRDGKQKKYGFITYKHRDSVSYALDLFEGTMLFNRVLSMRNRKVKETNSQDSSLSFNYPIQLGHQMLLTADAAGCLKLDMFGMNMLSATNSPSMQIDDYSYKDQKRSERMHSYQREQSKHDNSHTEHRSRSSHNNYRAHHYSRYDYRSSRRNYH